MSAFYTIDSANGLIPDVRKVLVHLRDQRNELIPFVDRLAEIDELLKSRTVADRASDLRLDVARADDDTADLASERWRLQLRTQAIVDQMQADVARIDEWGITLRDIDRGLIDFPALVAGRQVWLCWRLGEGDIDWWHEVSEGFGGRRRLVDLR